MLLFSFFTAAHATDVHFIADTSVLESSSGHIRLIWDAAQDTTFELQQATSQDFADAKRIYKGPDKASFVSGLDDGTYYFRVRAPGGAWSDTQTLRVQHQSLKLAFTLFGIGGVVFLLTVSVVITGTRRTAKNTQ